NSREARRLDIFFLKINQVVTAAAAISTTQWKWWLKNMRMLPTAPGPKYSTRPARTVKRRKRQRKIARRKWLMLISATAAPSANALNGVGGGSIAGNIRLQNGCFSKALCNFSKRAGDKRLRSNSSPPAYPMA